MDEVVRQRLLIAADILYEAGENSLAELCRTKAAPTPAAPVPAVMSVNKLTNSFSAIRELRDRHPRLSKSVCKDYTKSLNYLDLPNKNFLEAFQNFCREESAKLCDTLNERVKQLKQVRMTPRARVTLRFIDPPLIPKG